MRKIIRLLSIVGMLLVLVVSLGSEVYANPFDNDPNYLKYAEDEKSSYYVDLNSISNFAHGKHPVCLDKSA